MGKGHTDLQSGIQELNGDLKATRKEQKQELEGARKELKGDMGKARVEMMTLFLFAIGTVIFGVCYREVLSSISLY